MTDGDTPGPAWRLALLFVAEMVLLAVARLPEQQFSHYAFFDSGADLTIHDLIARGYRPMLDFGYIYGLLPLLINRLWFGLVGPSPMTAHLAMLGFCLVMAWGLARFVAALRVGPAGIALLMLAMNDMLQVSSFTLVHCLEPALLVHALAEQARGNSGRALALVSACVFVKPSMAYLYGLILVIAIVAAAIRARHLDWRRQFGPAIAVGLSLAIVLGLVYGARPLLLTLFSGSGLEVYRLSHFGFFRGDGRGFWYRPGAGIRGYLRYEIGAWIAGTFLLLGGGLVSLVRIVRHRPPARATPGDPSILTCALLHAGFVCLFFATRWSWVYYDSILLLGLAAMASRGRKTAGLVWCVAALVLISDRAQWQYLQERWSTDSAPAETAYLWAGPREREEWLKVRELIRGERAVLLVRIQGGALLFPGFAPPVGSYFVPGHPVPSEVARLAEQVAGASVVVRYERPGDRLFEYWPEVAGELDDFEPIWRGELMEVARRVRPRAGRLTPSSAPASPRGGTAEAPRR